MIDPGTIFSAILDAVLVSALLTMNLLDSRTGRAIRALRRGHIAGEAFGVQTPHGQASGVHLCGGAAGLSGWLYAHFQRSANPTAVRRAGRHRISVHRGGRRRGYVWAACSARDRRDPERDFAELPTVYFRRQASSKPSCSASSWSAAATGADRRLALADGAAALSHRARSRPLACRSRPRRAPSTPSRLLHIEKARNNLAA